MLSLMWVESAYIQSRSVSVLFAECGSGAYRPTWSTPGSIEQDSICSYKTKNIFFIFIFYFGRHFVPSGSSFLFRFRT
jgi:hypothetical protein